jgi:hypothetical protein
MFGVEGPDMALCPLRPVSIWLGPEHRPGSAVLSTSLPEAKVPALRGVIESTQPPGYIGVACPRCSRLKHRVLPALHAAQGAFDKGRRRYSWNILKIQPYCNCRGTWQIPAEACLFPGTDSGVPACLLS